MKKQKSLTFVAFMLLASLIATSCGGDSPEQTVTSASDSAETTDEVKSDAYPYQINKLDGKEIRFLNCVDEHWQGASQIIDYDSYTGESVADAFYKKNREAEEALGIKVIPHNSKCGDAMTCFASRQFFRQTIQRIRSVASQLRQGTAPVKDFL